jgi:hypothetical protein
MQRVVKNSRQTALMMEFLQSYTEELFSRLHETRRVANLQRIAITSQNPHMSKRRVAAQLDEMVEALSMLKACISVMPMVEEYSRALAIKVREVFTHSATTG